MVAATESGVRLMSMEVTNFMAIKYRQLDINGRHVQLSGTNSVGKSSIGNALWAGILGLSKFQFPEPVYHGAEFAHIKIGLGEFRIDRKIFRGEKRDRLKVTRRDGSPVPEPHTFLKSLISAICRDPGKFLKQRPQDQVDDVLRIHGVVPPVESVRRLTNETHTPRPGDSAATYLE